MIKLTTIAEQHDISSQRLKYQMQRTGIPIIKAQKILFVDEKNLFRTQALIAKLKLCDVQQKTPEQKQKAEYQRKRYENKKLQEMGLPTVAFTRGRPKLEPGEAGKYTKELPEKEEPIWVMFNYNGIAKKGVVIGGLNRFGCKTAMVRFKHNGFSQIAEPKYSEILNKTEAEVETMVVNAQKRTRE